MDNEPISVERLMKVAESYYGPDCTVRFVIAGNDIRGQVESMSREGFSKQLVSVLTPELSFDDLARQLLNKLINEGKH